MPARHFPIAPAGRAAFHELVETVAAQLDDPARDRNDVVRDLLLTWYYPGLDADEVLEDPGASPALKAAVACCDPRNVTLEPEYYLEIDPVRFAPVKPLAWLWIMFDRSPLGHNVRLGTAFRGMLAKRCFRRCGDRVRIFQDVQFSFGYNLSVGDDVVIHRHVLLDDRGEIEIGNRVSISDYVNVYSHSHDIHDIHDVRLDRTVIASDTRLTYHSTVLSGVRMGEQSMLACQSVANRPVPPFTVAGGLPAKPLRVKDTAPFEHPLKKG